MFLPQSPALALALAVAASLPESSHGDKTLTDAQIAHIAVTANQLDVAAARQALDLSSNDDVLAFAQTMIRDHEAVIARATKLASELGITPEHNETSKALSSAAAATRNRLATLQGAAFDRAYIDNEVSYHETVIAAIRDTLIPATHAVELEKLLQDVIPALEAHLERAKSLSKELRG